MRCSSEAGTAGRWSWSMVSGCVMQISRFTGSDHSPPPSAFERNRFCVNSATPRTGKPTRAEFRVIKGGSHLCAPNACRRSPRTAQTGAVTLIQRFGSALNLNVHFHMASQAAPMMVRSRCRLGARRSGCEKCAGEPVAAANSGALTPLSDDQCAAASAARRYRRR